MSVTNSVKEYLKNTRMKHLIYLALILQLSACSESEEPKFCFECSTFIVTTSPTGYYNEETVEFEECGKTDADADRIEAEGTSQTNEGPNTIIKETTCTKKN
jgi:hypothetical protein